MKRVLVNRVQASAFCGELLAMDYAKPVEVDVKAFKPKKTYKQVKYAHGIMQFIAIEQDRSVEATKIIMKSNFGLFRVHTCFITGQRLVDLTSLANYNREEIEAFITQLEHYCDSNGIKYIEAGQDD